MVKNKTRQKPVNAWVSLCLVTKRLANWGELLSERPWVRIPPGTPRRNGLRSIQKAQPFGWAFLIPLRHSSFSPQNFALQTFVGAPLYGPGRERASISSRKLTAEQGQSLAPLFLCHNASSSACSSQRVLRTLIL